MAMIKRLSLFLIVNVLVIVTITVTTSLLGIRHWATANGIDYNALLAFCAVAGFSGAIISLLLSRWMAKMMMGVQVIDPNRTNSQAEREIYSMVQRLAQRAGLPKMPEVGVYDSPEVNAFATGPSKSRSLVAVSTGLLQRMDHAAVEGVVSHEIAHIANGDMVTMTLIQGVVNTFVMFFARIAAWAVASFIEGNRDNRESSGALSGLVQFVAVIVFEILFSILGAIVVSAFSRWREYRADRGGAEIGGREKMIHALQSLKQSIGMEDDGRAPSLATLKINGKAKGLLALFSSHPDLDDRIAALQKMRV